MPLNKNLTRPEIESIFGILKTRFFSSRDRFEQLNWGDIKSKLEQNLDKLSSINEMEKTEGAPNLLEFNGDKN